jgi:hypothetical protein
MSCHDLLFMLRAPLAGFSREHPLMNALLGGLLPRLSLLRSSTIRSFHECIQEVQELQNVADHLK